MSIILTAIEIAFYVALAFLPFMYVLDRIAKKDLKDLKEAIDKEYSVLKELEIQSTYLKLKMLTLTSEYLIFKKKEVQTFQDTTSLLEKIRNLSTDIFNENLVVGYLSQDLVCLSNKNRSV